MTTIKKTIITLLAIVLFSSNSFANAAKAPVPTTIETEDPLTVQYLGEQDGYLVFQVSMSNADVKVASLVIDDKTEGEIYTSAFRGNKIQTLKIEKRDSQELSFKLQIGKKSYSKSFIVVPTVVLAKL